jgi:hypothetical protein
MIIPFSMHFVRQEFSDCSNVILYQSYIVILQLYNKTIITSISLCSTIWDVILVCRSRLRHNVNVSLPRFK